MLPFVPYAIIALVHLGTLLASHGFGSTVTKPFLMPALLLAILWSLRARPTWLLACSAVALAFSFLGDVLLQAPGDIGFLLGLGAFMLAHLAYLLLFLKPLRERRIPWYALVYAVWWIALVVLLAPHIGPLLIAVAAYGFVLAASSAAALGAGRVAAVGALIFLLSDTILAFKMFVPGWAFYPVDFIIMTLYLVGQGLIAYAVVSRGYRLQSQPGLSAPQPERPLGRARP